MANRLSQEKSPYLLQHKDNPVNWFPWCEEAFEQAKCEDKPILLSIGYSTCHWCHVMAHESFEDTDIAQILNAHFVSIKVDREEHPEIDAVYMQACQLMTGFGGWPLTILMTPDGKPFFAGTYLPKNNRGDLYGLSDLLQQVSKIWHSDRSALEKNANQITAILNTPHSESGQPDKELLDAAYQSLYNTFDAQWGGFGAAPKFPAAHNLLFLMQYEKQSGTEMATTTLRAMACGGIFDQIGGGFSRYSTDAKWLVPHFEKMLYDNALLIMAYTDAYRRTQIHLYADIARRTADYILRELRAPCGGCYCGQDADSEGVEGKFYKFTPRDINDALGEQDGSEFCRLYGIDEHNSIPNLIHSPQNAWSFYDPRLNKLYAYRKKRYHLHTDDKILLAWNAWTIIALAQCGQELAEQSYIDSAIAIQQFIESNMTDANNRLFVRFRDGEAANAGLLDDYAVYALALLILYRITEDTQYLDAAIYRTKQMIDFFEDKNGGYYLTAHDAQQLIARPKETYDGAMPSGNSVAAMVLESLTQLSDDTQWQDAADRQMRFLAGQIKQYPSGYCFALLAMEKSLQADAQKNKQQE